MNRRTPWLVLFAPVLVVGLLYLYPVTYAARASDGAIGQLSRAETAQTADGIIQHVIMAKRELPESGYVTWWSKTDFASIQDELDVIIFRAGNITVLAPEDKQWISEMHGIHADLEAIQEKLIKAYSTLW